MKILPFVWILVAVALLCHMGPWILQVVSWILYYKHNILQNWKLKFERAIHFDQIINFIGTCNILLFSSTVPSGLPQDVWEPLCLTAEDATPGDIPVPKILTENNQYAEL